MFVSCNYTAEGSLVCDGQCTAQAARSSSKKYGYSGAVKQVKQSVSHEGFAVGAPTASSTCPPGQKMISVGRARAKATSTLGHQVKNSVKVS